MFVIFMIMSIVATASALAVVCFRNPIYSALALILNLICVAGFFAMLDAHFLAVVQIVVYAGAIMVLVLFLLMLLNIKVEVVKPFGRIYWLLATLIGLSFLYISVPAMNSFFARFKEPNEELVGSVRAMGEVLYTRYIFPFEAASVLILAAIVGAVMLAKRHYRRPQHGTN